MNAKLTLLRDVKYQQFLLRWFIILAIEAGAILGWIYFTTPPPPAPVNPEIFFQTGHAVSDVLTVAWSPDGSLLASGSEDNTVKLWEKSSGKLLRTFSGGHTGSVHGLAWSPDGLLLASCGEDRALRLWDVPSGRLLNTLLEEAPVLAVAWSPDGSLLVTGGAEHTLSVWESSSGKRLRIIPAHSDAVTSVAWSPDGRLLATGSKDHSIKLWQARSIQLLHTFTDHTDVINAVAWSPDGRTLATGSEDSTIKLWDVSTGTLLHNLANHVAAVNAVAWSPDGQTLITGSMDGTIKCWKASSGAVLRTFLHNRVYPPMALAAWHRDGRTLAVGHGSGGIDLWDASTGDLQRAFSTTPPGFSMQPKQLAFSPDGQTLAAMAEGLNREPHLWDVSSGNLLKALRVDSTVQSFAWSADGRTIAVGGLDNTIDLFDVSTNTIELLLRSKTRFQLALGVAWSADGRVVAATSEYGDINVWNAASGTLLNTFIALAPYDKEHYPVWSLSWSPDGRLLAVVTSQNTVTLWEAFSGKLVRTLDTDASEQPVVWHPGGKILATLGKDHLVRLWQPESGKLLRTFSEEPGIRSVAWSPDGVTLAMGGGDNTLKLWETSSGPHPRLLSGHLTPVVAVAWSPEGSLLASRDASGLIFLWTRSGELKRIMTSKPGNVWLAYEPTSLSYVASQDGARLAAMRFDSRTWPVYSLIDYQTELRREDLSQASGPPPPTLAPHPYLQTWEDLEDKDSWLAGALAGSLLLTLVWQLFSVFTDPMRLARRFFSSAGFTQIQRAPGYGYLLFMMAPGGGTAHALLWQKDWEKRVHGLSPRNPTYLLYAELFPESAQLQALRARVGGEVIALSTRVLDTALARNKVRSALQEAEDRFVTRRDPYDEANPVEDPAWFQGRGEYLTRIPETLQQGRHVGLFGLRKMGKTSLLRQLRNRISTAPIVDIDCQELAPVALDYLHRILVRTHEELSRLHVRKLPKRPRALQDVKDFRERFLQLHECWRKSGQSGPILVFLDEIDKLFVDRRRTHSVTALGEYVRLFQVLRALGQQHQCVALLVAAYRPEINRQNELMVEVGENPMFMSFQETFLGNLNAEETWSLIREIGLWKGIHWAPEALQELYAECGGHPFLTRLLASESCERGALHSVGVRQVQQVVQKIHSRFRMHRIGEYYQESIWKVLQPEEQRVLQAVAREEEGLEAGALPSELVEALIQLEHLGLVRREADRLLLPARLLRRWLVQGGYV